MLTMSAVMMPTAQLAAIPTTAQLPIVQTAKFDPKYVLNHNPQATIANNKPGTMIFEYARDAARAINYRIRLESHERRSTDGIFNVRYQVDKIT